MIVQRQPQSVSCVVPAYCLGNQGKEHQQQGYGHPLTYRLPLQHYIHLNGIYNPV